MVIKIAIRSTPCRPSLASVMPLKTEVNANDVPVIDPTIPLALSRCSSDKSMVTKVGRAMLLMLPAITPSSRIIIRLQYGKLLIV